MIIAVISSVPQYSGMVPS